MKTLFYLITAVICIAHTSAIAEKTTSELVVNEEIGMVYFQKVVPSTEALTKKEQGLLKAEARQMLNMWTEQTGRKILIIGNDPKWIIHLEQKKGYVLLTVAFAHVVHVGTDHIICETIQ